ncbi:MAG: TolC family protein, partial [Bacteroidales bacterium]|nr:TolC family protein [Bacteroidales bacterium]
MRINKLFVIMCLLPSMIFAQQTVPISKTKVLEKVSSQNNKLKIGEQDVSSAKGDFNQTNAVFLPNISTSYTGMATNSPLMAFGFKLNQAVVAQEDFNPANLNNPSKTNMFTTTFEVQQPIINIDGVFQRKAAKAKWGATRMQLKRMGDYLSLETEKAYMQLQLAYKSVEVLEEALKAAKENLNLATNSFKQGYLQHSDVLTVEVRVAEVENQVQYAKSNVINISEYLAVLMNEEIAGVYKPTDSLDIALSLISDEYISNNRADIKAMQFATEAYRQSYKADRMSFLPRLNAFGSYELYDDQIFSADANAYLVGVSLTWDIFQGSKRVGK